MSRRRRALVVGLGRSGRAAAALLARRGWDVVAVDSRPLKAPELTAAGVEVRAAHAGAVADVDLVVKSPGVPGASEPVAAARAAGAPVWSEVELAARELHNPLIGVTGTNGKTTTTELTAHLLRASGIAARACGNQGDPVAALVDAVDPAEWLVVECSSFQLEDAHTLHVAGAALLNLAPDHLDRHASFDDYRSAKLRLFRNQSAADLAILPAGMEPGGAAPARRVELGAATSDAVAWGEGGVHVAGLGRVAGWDELQLRGAHNRHNALVAAALAAHAGAGAAGIAEGLASFAPVAHRLEPVGSLAGALYVNDSKATNPDAAIAALGAYDRGVHLIAGGRGKDTLFDELAAVARRACVRAYVVGETAPELAEAFERAGVPCERPGTVAAAVAAAAGRAQAGEVVLLAPACASLDQFADYAERGDAFRAAAHAAGAR